jgi:hypothetical protein
MQAPDRCPSLIFTLPVQTFQAYFFSGYIKANKYKQEQLLQYDYSILYNLHSIVITIPIKALWGDFANQ